MCTELQTGDVLDIDDEGLCAAFMESAATNLKATMSFLVGNADIASKLGVYSGSAVQHTVMVELLNPDLTVAFKLPHGHRSAGAGVEEREGNPVLALGRAPSNVHTPLGSAPADSIQ